MEVPTLHITSLNKELQVGDYVYTDEKGKGIILERRWQDGNLYQVNVLWDKDFKATELEWIEVSKLIPVK